jgi:putative membrane protein insertion efficiency factor
MKRLSQALRIILLVAIRFYQIFISPLHPACCRFYPTCSQYAIEAIQKKGPGEGNLDGYQAYLQVPSMA